MIGTLLFSAYICPMKHLKNKYPYFFTMAALNVWMWWQEHGRIIDNVWIFSCVQDNSSPVGCMYYCHRFRASGTTLCLLHLVPGIFKSSTTLFSVCHEMDISDYLDAFVLFFSVHIPLYFTYLASTKLQANSELYSYEHHVGGEVDFYDHNFSRKSETNSTNFNNIKTSKNDQQTIFSTRFSVQRSTRFVSWLSYDLLRLYVW